MGKMQIKNIVSVPKIDFVNNSFPKTESFLFHDPICKYGFDDLTIMGERMMRHCIDKVFIYRKHGMRNFPFLEMDSLFFGMWKKTFFKNTKSIVQLSVLWFSFCS